MKLQLNDQLARLRSGASPLLDQAKTAWDGRSGREQALLAAMAVCLVLAGAYTLAVAPALQSRADIRADIARLDHALAQTRGAEPVAAPGAADARPASVRLTTLAADEGLSILRLEETGARRTIVLEDAPFEVVARWIVGIERAPDLTVVGLSVERRPTPGLVSTRIEIEGR